MRIRFLFYSAIVLLLGSCVKEVNELPPATQIGANTFGCKVDGSFWVPKGFSIFPASDLLEAMMLPDHTLIINARNYSKSPNETEFEIRIKNVVAPGEYFFNNDVVHPSLTYSYAYYVQRKFTPVNEWITTSHFTGKVTITKIETGANAIASGTFEFDAGNLANDGRFIRVTEGRFDVKLL